MKTYQAKLSEIKPKWYLVDAEGKVLGRLASQVAQVLRGKGKPIFSPHLETGDHVIVINASKIVLRGKKSFQKKYYRHTGYPGGLKTLDFTKLLQLKPTFVVEHAIRGMLPHNTLGRRQKMRLHVYPGGEHPHQAQKPQVLDIKRKEV